MRYILALLAAAAMALAPLPAIAQVSSDIGQLSKRARVTYSAIIAAARAGDLEALQAVIDRQGEPVGLGFGGAETAAEFAIGNSTSGDGLDVLAELVDLLELPYMREQTPNVTYYVWPYLDRMSLDEMTVADRVAAYQLVSPADLENFIEFGGWLSFRIAIDADGTWVFWAAGD